MIFLPPFFMEEVMRLVEAIGNVDSLKKNQVPDDMKRKWLSDLEGLIIQEIILTHEIPDRLVENEAVNTYVKTEGTEDVYGAETDGETLLLAPPPYDDVYFWWLAAKIDMAAGDTKKYESDTQMYNNAYLTLQDFWNRTYMPLQKVCGFMRGAACGMRREQDVSSTDRTEE